MLRQKITLLLSLILLLALYFWAHNVGEQPAILVRGFTTLVTVALDILTVAAIIVVGGGIGCWIREKVALTDLHRAERVALESGLGLGVISIGALLLGLVGLFNLVMWGALALVAVLLRTSIRGWLIDMRGVLASALRPQTAWERFILIVAAIMLALALILALAPPAAWDAMTYHLLGPSRYIQAGRITTQANNHFLGFPQGMEMLYGLALTLTGRVSSAASLHLYMGFLVLIVVASVVRRYANRSTAYTSVLLALSSISLWRLFSIPYVDLAVMLYAALALVAVLRWRETDQAMWLALVGVFAGLALGVKYTAGLYIVALGIFILLRQPHQVVRNGLIFGGMVLLVFVPWLIKGALLYQNPIYPYILNGVSWDSLRTANFNSSGNGMLNGENAWQWFVLPLSASILGNEDVGTFGFNLGPWLLLLPFMLLLGRGMLSEKARSLAKDGGLLALIMLALWMLMAAFSGIGAQPRLVIFGFPMMIALGALALHSLDRWPKQPLNIGFILRIALAFTVLMNFFNIAHTVARKDLPRYYVDHDVDGYLTANLGNYYPALRHLGSLPAGSTVMLMWEPKSTYCPPTVTCIPDILFDNWSHPLRLGSTPDELMQRWQAEGVDYLLVLGLTDGINVGYDFWLEEHDVARAENAQFPTMLDEEMEPVWTDGFAYTLYAWKS